MCFVTVRFYFSSIFFEFFSCKAIALLSKTYYLYLILIYIDVNFLIIYCETVSRYLGRYYNAQIRKTAEFAAAFKGFC